jgi:hypothetical protein
VASNYVEWQCSAFSSDVSDEIIVEDNDFNCTKFGDVNGGSFIATYDLYHHPSSRRWSIARNRFSRPLQNWQNASTDSWQFHETLTTDSPHSYNMGYVQEIMEVNTTTTTVGGATTGTSSAVRLGSRLFPPAGATLLVLGGPGERVGSNG